MRIFICAGEPSGDLHGANLVRCLRKSSPDVECVGFGGDRMAAAGCSLLYPLCHLAVMWVARVLANAHVFLSLLSRADRFFRHQRPDAVVLIDYPGFNWWMARRAHFHGIPVFYFVPPQLWGWGGWRVKKMQRFVDHVLCSLPFETSWYAERGVHAHFVGHPYFDELPEQVLDPTFLATHREQAGPIVGLLPGSRNQEVERNLPMLLDSAAKIHKARPDARFLVASFKESQRQYMDAHIRARKTDCQSVLQSPPLPISTHVGKTPEIIQLAHACVAVSGSVGLELLYREKPSVVVYRVSALDMRVCRWIKKSPFISLVNLLAEKELYPEFLTDHCEAPAIAGHILRWLDEPAAYGAACAELAALRRKVAAPGACQRAADFVLNHLQGSKAAPHIAAA